MKFGITARITLALALAGALAAGLTGYYALSASRALLIQSAQEELLLSTQVLARRVVITRQEVSRNLQVLANYPATQLVFERDDATAKEQLATLFKVLMDANGAYLQIRLISAANYGLERVRADRDKASVRIISSDDLQEKGHFNYVFETLKLRLGETYLSPIGINHEVGSHTGLGRPTVTLSTPVGNAQGAVVGLIVINLDLNTTFDLLSADLPRNYALYLANHQGDLLLHPDPDKTFGFDKGRRYFLHDEFPDLKEMVRASVSALVSDTTLLTLEQNGTGHPLLAAFVARNVASRSAEDRLILGLSRPLKEVLLQSNELAKTIVQLVLLVSLGCIFLAVLVARALTRPINSVISAIEKFSSDGTALPLPTNRSDEIGTLARSLSQMQTQIREQVEALQHNQQQLEHLAQHDPLTTLPNRRLFMNRLELALARAKHNNDGLMVLFIDVDQFKQINDEMGHAVGDAVLQNVAQRLGHFIRETDTAARLGGDEFVVMLDQIKDRDTVGNFTEDLLRTLKTPITVDEKTLSVKFSIGIAGFPENGDTVHALIRAADEAMYLAKTSGRNTYRFTTVHEADHSSNA